MGINNQAYVNDLDRALALLFSFAKLFDGLGKTLLLNHVENLRIHGIK